MELSAKRAKRESAPAGDGGEGEPSLPHPDLFFNLFGGGGEERISRLVSPEVTRAVLASYVADADFACRRWPHLAAIPVFLVSGDRRSLPLMPALWQASRPETGEYGVMHSKIMVLLEEELLDEGKNNCKAVTVVITSANLLQSDYEKRQQIFYSQRFTERYESEPLASDERGIRYTLARNDFREVLVDHLVRMNVPEDLTKVVRQFTFSEASVALVASVPGEFSKSQAHNYGHLRVQRLLAIHNIAEDKSAPLYAQVTSCAMLKGDYVAELCASFGTGKLRIIWPSVEHVRSGLNGYEDGSHICLDESKYRIAANFIQHQYVGLGEEIVSPHMKCFMRGESSPFFLAGSHNMSASAWGRRRQNALVIHSFEMSFLVISDGSARDNLVRALPFQFPPPLFGITARPWIWSKNYQTPDVHGCIFFGDQKLTIPIL